LLVGKEIGCSSWGRVNQYNSWCFCYLLTVSWFTFLFCASFSIQLKIQSIDFDFQSIVFHCTISFPILLYIILWFRKLCLVFWDFSVVSYFISCQHYGFNLYHFSLLKNQLIDFQFQLIVLVVVASLEVM